MENDKRLKFKSKSDKFKDLYNIIIFVYVGLNLTAWAFTYELPLFIHVLIVVVALKLVNFIKGR